MLSLDGQVDVDLNFEEFPQNKTGQILALVVAKSINCSALEEGITSGYFFFSAALSFGKIDSTLR